jgi:hypothetical protein
LVKKKIEIEGLKAEYWATDIGLIYSTKSKKFLKPTTNHKGYGRVDFYINGIPKKLFVHRLILSTFNPVDNMEELKNAINKVFDSEQEEMAKNSLKAIKPYTIENMVQVHLNRLQIE